MIIARGFTVHFPSKTLKRFHLCSKKMVRFYNTQAPNPSSYTNRTNFTKPHFKRSSNNIPLSNNRSKLSIPYKSAMCVQYQRGKCYYGDNCHFSHTLSGIRNPGLNRDVVVGMVGRQQQHCSTNVVVMSDGIECNKTMNNNAGERGCFDWGLSGKKYLCKKWQRFGNCWYGDRCIFAHGNDELLEQPLGSSAETPYEYDPKTKLASLPQNNQPSRGTGIKSAANANNKMQPTGKRCFVKWDVEKMSEIYGDWIGVGTNLHFD